MANGLLGMGVSSRRQVGSVFDQLAGMEHRRNRTNEAMERQEKSRRISAAATGAGIGAQVATGTAMGGPAGAAIGLGVGLLASDVF